MFNKTIWPLVIMFLLTAGIILVLRNYLNHYGIDWQVVSGGNLIIYVITFISLHLLSKGLKAESTPSFLTHSFGGILLKLLVCIMAALVYIFIARKNLNKPSLFICMGLYLVYTFIEMKIVLKQSKALKDGRK